MMFDRRTTFWALYLPPLLWLGAFFLIPLALMAAFSLRADTSGEVLRLWTPTLKQYSSLFDIGSYWRLLGISALIALVVAASATLLAYPIAYFLAFRAGARAGLYLVLLLVPFWTSYLTRAITWLPMFGREGVVNSVLLYLGIINQPIEILLYTPYSMMWALWFLYVVFMIGPLYHSMRRIDEDVMSAADFLPSTPFLTCARKSVR